MAYNQKHEDYVKVVCGSPDRLPAAFVQLDQDQREQRLAGIPTFNVNDLETVLRVLSASVRTSIFFLSVTVDRGVAGPRGRYNNLAVYIRSP